jgi:hypothetical protein
MCTLFFFISLFLILFLAFKRRKNENTKQENLSEIQDKNCYTIFAERVENAGKVFVCGSSAKHAVGFLNVIIFRWS